jgi:hypothetical protein
MTFLHPDSHSSVLLQKESKQAGAELCQAQFKLGLVKPAIVFFAARLCRRHTVIRMFPLSIAGNDGKMTNSIENEKHTKTKWVNMVY